MHHLSIRTCLAATLVVLPGFHFTPAFGHVAVRQSDDGSAGDPPENPGPTPIKALLDDLSLKAEAPDLWRSLVDILGPDPDANSTDPGGDIHNTAETKVTLDNGTEVSSSMQLADYKLNKRHMNIFPRQGRYPDDVRQREFPVYLALGDSYSASPGAGLNFDPEPPFPPKYRNMLVNGCVTTQNAWPVLLHNYLQIGGHQDFFFNACTGFNTDDIVNSAIDGPAAKWPTDPDLVSVTMGGNNGQSFIGVIFGCAIGGPWSSGCQRAIDHADDVFEKIGGDLARVLLRIRAKNRTRPFGVDVKTRTVLVMGYPKLYEEGFFGNIFCRMTQKRRKNINGLVDKLNTELMRLSDLIGKDSPHTSFVFMDPNNPDAQHNGIARPLPTQYSFTGNRYCSSTNWGRSFFSFLGKGGTSDWGSYFSGSYHPNAAGNNAMYAAARQALALHYPQ